MRLENQALRYAPPLSVMLLLLWTVGCSGSRSVTDNRPDLPDTFPNHTSAAIVQQVRLAFPDTVSALKATASLSIHSPEMSGTVTARIEHRRNDSLFMSLTAALGIEAARILITPDSFFVYDRLKKQLNYGSLDFAATVLPAPLAGDDVYRNLLGLLTLDESVDWQLEADPRYYHLRDRSGRYHYVVDPTLWRVVRYEERTAAGDLLEARTFTEHDVFDGLYLPRRIILQRPLDDTNVSMYYRTLTLTPPTLSFALNVGDSVERVLIDEDYGSSKE